MTKEVINFLEKQTGYDMLVRRSDNGTEYFNHDLRDFLNSKGELYQTVMIRLWWSDCIRPPHATLLSRMALLSV